MTQARQRITRTAYSLCREWRQTFLKQQYEAAMAPEDDNEAVALVVAVTDAAMHELERDIVAAPMATTEDVKAVLGVALAIMGDELTRSERAARLIRAARRGLDGFCNTMTAEAA